MLRAGYDAQQTANEGAAGEQSNSHSSHGQVSISSTAEKRKLRAAHIVQDESSCGYCVWLGVVAAVVHLSLYAKTDNSTTLHTTSSALLNTRHKQTERCEHDGCRTCQARHCSYLHSFVVFATNMLSCRHFKCVAPVLP
jgi:hypothetical protein